MGLERPCYRTKVNYAKSHTCLWGPSLPAPSPAALTQPHGAAQSPPDPGAKEKEGREGQRQDSLLWPVSQAQGLKSKASHPQVGDLSHAKGLPSPQPWLTGSLSTLAAAANHHPEARPESTTPLPMSIHCHRRS